MPHAHRNPHRRWSSLSFLLMLLLLLGCTAVQGTCKGCGEARKLKPRVTFTLANGKTLEVQVELACTPAERQEGLMFRRSLGETAGMLFLFPAERVQGFWMKNTYIPLDMIHINQKREIVGIVENAKPHSLDSRSVGAPAMYVLEVNAFFARKHGIAKGQKVAFVDVPACP